ncbi:MAG: hypothetical protein R3B82_21310 [Sandaracinaceae bacterium]
MSGDEMIAGALALLVLWVVLARQVLPMLMLSRLVAPPRLRLSLLVFFVVAGAVVHVTMVTASSWDVQSSALYTAYYDLIGAAWIGLAILGMHHLGLSLRDDVLERRNPAALFALGGALVGHAFAYAGGNIGDGPGWWCVVIASGLGALTLFAAWLVLHLVARVPETITVERDRSAGIRVGALFVGIGLVAGRAAAGTWVSVEDTVWSFAAVAWPVVPLLGLSVAIELGLQPPRVAPRPVSGLVALGYLGASAGVVYVHGAAF